MGARWVPRGRFGAGVLGRGGLPGAGAQLVGLAGSGRGLRGALMEVYGQDTSGYTEETDSFDPAAWGWSDWHYLYDDGPVLTHLAWPDEQHCG